MTRTESSATGAFPSLRENFGWTLAGNLTYAASMWLLLVVLARLTNPEAVGQFALGLAIATPVFLLSSLNLRIVEATDARLEYSFHDYLVLRLGGVAAGLAVSTAVAFAANRGRDVTLVILLVSVMKAVELVSDIYLGLLQQHEAMKWIGVSQALRGAGGFAAFFFSLLAGAELWGATLALSVAFIAILVLYDIPRSRRTYGSAPEAVRRPADSARVKRLLRIAMPMGIVTALGSYAVNAPRYAIEVRLGTRELGIFAALAAIVLAGNTVIGALAQASTPRLARLAAESDALGFRRLLVRLQLGALAIGTCGILAALLFGRDILALLFGAEYAEETGLFSMLMVLAAVMYFSTFLGTAVTALRQFGVQARIHLANAILVTLSSAVLVPSIGLDGAAWSLIVGALFVTLSYGFVARRSLAALSSARGSAGDGAAS